jgi:PAS domain S-box-containing protein
MQPVNHTPIPLVSPSGTNDAYYHSILETLPAAVYTCDVNGYIKWYNAAATELWGRRPKLGTDLWCGSWKIYTQEGELLSLDQCPMARTLKEQKTVAGQEIIVERPDGERRIVLPHPQPIFDQSGRLTGAVNMLVDVTQHKQDEVLAQKLKDSNEQLEQFAYAASHDLQEPLRKIQTFVNLLMEQKGGQVDPTVEKYLQKITDASGRMSQLIEALLNYTRYTKAGAPTQPTDLNEIVQGVQSDLELLLQQKGGVLHCASLPVIHAVPAQMERLFYNLVNNALKFAREGVAPEIRIEAAQTPTHVQLCISDNGIGFEQRFAEKIFGMFERLNDKFSYPGTGIGLSLCKKVVENHKGAIWAESEPGQGATFYIQLPASVLVGPAQA